MRVSWLLLISQRLNGVELRCLAGRVKAEKDAYGGFVSMSCMLEMLRDLIAHKGHANAAVLAAIRQNEAAASDPELFELLHHILLANRFWLLSVLG